VTGESFRAGMRRLCGGVTIVTSFDTAGPVGLTATAVCSLSVSPPRLIACVNRAGRTYRAIAHSRQLTVNLLAVHHRELAERFAGRMGDAERFACGRWHFSAEHAPVLEDALAAFVCRAAFLVDVGSHALIVADVVRVDLGASATPLVYLAGRFDQPVHGLAGEDDPPPSRDEGRNGRDGGGDTHASLVSSAVSACREEEVPHER